MKLAWHVRVISPQGPCAPDLSASKLQLLPGTSPRTSMELNLLDSPYRFLKPSRNDFCSPLVQRRYTLVQAFVTGITMVFTIYFAFNSSLEQPLSPSLILSKPERTILALNIASQLTIFFLGELFINTFEGVRWALAASAKGVSAFTFLTLGRATTPMGVLCLLGGKQGARNGGHRLWATQRYFSSINSNLDYYFSLSVAYWEFYSSQIPPLNLPILKFTNFPSFLQVYLL
jgi:hypothetical protein